MTSSVQTNNVENHPVLRAARSVPHWYASTTHANALNTIAHAVDHQKGYACVFGEPGSGKTAVLNAYATHAWRGYVHAVRIDARPGGYATFLQTVLARLRIEAEDREPRWLRRRFQLAAQLHLAKEKPLALLVDNAQLLDDEVLTQLHLLLDSSAGQESVLQIVLAGTAELDSRLRSPILAPVNQRLVARAVLTPIEYDQRIEFVQTLLSQKSMATGYDLPERTLRRIARKSRGNPGELISLTKDAVRRLNADTNLGFFRSRSAAGPRRLAEAPPISSDPAVDALFEGQ